MSNIYESDKAENSANLKAGMSTPGLVNANEARRASLRERVENQKNHSNENLYANADKPDFSRNSGSHLCKGSAAVQPFALRKGELS